MADPRNSLARLYHDAKARDCEWLADMYLASIRRLTEDKVAGALNSFRDRCNEFARRLKDAKDTNGPP